jgi:hypothetical protein
VKIDEECYCACHGTKYNHLHIPVVGEYLVRDGKVLTVLETDKVDSGTDEHDTYHVYTETEDDDGT